MKRNTAKKEKIKMRLEKKKMDFRTFGSTPNIHLFKQSLLERKMCLGWVSDGGSLRLRASCLSNVVILCVLFRKTDFPSKKGTDGDRNAVQPGSTRMFLGGDLNSLF